MKGFKIKKEKQSSGTNQEQRVACMNQVQPAIKKKALEKN